MRLAICLLALTCIGLQVVSGVRRAIDSSQQTKACSQQSMVLARQMIIHELETLNGLNSIWFNDFDQAELIERQKQSLSNIVMSGAATRLLNSDGQPLMEIEASYFRPISGHTYRQHFSSVANTTTIMRRSQNINNNNGHQSMSAHIPQPITLRLMRRHQDKCYLNEAGTHFNYVLAISVGPLEHNLDVIYNLPKELRLSQPLDARFAQISLIIPRLTYQITLKQVANYKLLMAPETISARWNSCPLEVSDVTFVSSKSSPSIVISGLAANNQTAMQVDRIFDDYSRPAISHRLRQMLKFNLNTKTLPLQI